MTSDQSPSIARMPQGKSNGASSLIAFPNSRRNRQESQQVEL